MALSSLLDGIARLGRDGDVEVADITLDSRTVVPGACFVALRGSREDGMKHARDAAARGAVAVLAERPGRAGLPIPVIEVNALPERLGEIARRFFGDPAARVRVLAVTGTNGKSTVAHVSAQLLRLLGQRCGYIGTLGAGEPDALEPTGMTTPDVLSLNRWLCAMEGAGIGTAALEASSHALRQRRLEGIRLHAAAFTNLGHDHLDYHRDLEAYARSKRALFERDGLGAAVVNVDDPFGAQVANALTGTVEVWTCSSRGAAARLRASRIAATLDGIAFTLHAPGGEARVECPLAGRFNVDNVLIAAGFALSLGHALESVCAALRDVRTVSGRMEPCGVTRRGARVLVDYAHSPDSLEAVLVSLRACASSRLVVVFGCGGERDRSKRPLMGAVAERLADSIILTSDNPRGEDNAEIVREIVAGMRSTDAVLVEHDRERAIRLALGQAGRDDIVLVAGKGHERVQQQGGRCLPFSDHAVIQRALGGGAA